MKTTKLILSIALVALATTSFAQCSSFKERLFNKQNNQIEYVSAAYSNNESSRIESWMHDLRSWASNRASRDAYIVPVVTRTIVIEQADIVYEEEFGLENWMATPFESTFDEAEICIETWMVSPFENTIVDEELILESWMTTPFEVTEVIELEEWMTAAWI